MANTVNELIEAGKLKEEDVLDYARGLNEDLSALQVCAARMHTLLCRANKHEHSVEALNTRDAYDTRDVCYWYVEESLTSCWEEPSHKEWLERCRTQMAHMGMSSAKDFFFNFLVEFTKTVAAIESTIELHPSAKGLFRQLLDC